MFAAHISGPGGERSVALRAAPAETVFGRDARADVSLADLDKAISRRHFALQVDGDGVVLRVLSTVNGLDTSRGEAAVGASLRLQAGDRLSLGPYSVLIVADAAPAAAVAAGEPFSALFAGSGPVADGAALDPLNQPEFSRLPVPAPVNDGRDPFDDLFGSPKLAAGLGPVGPRMDAGDPLSLVTAAPLAGGNRGMSAIDALLASGPAPALHAAQSPLVQLQQPRVDPAPTLDHVDDVNLPLRLPPVRPAQAAPATDDPWASLGGDSGGAAAPAAAPPAGVAPAAAPLAPATDDPFAGLVGDSVFEGWGERVAVETPAASAPPPVATPAPVPQAPPAPTPAAGADRATELAAFVSGIGLPAARVSNMKEEDWRHAGQMLRRLIEGLAELLAARTTLKSELRTEDRTMLGARDNNPLKMKLPLATVVQFFFGGPKPVKVFMPPERALREVFVDLQAHEIATLAAARAAIEGALLEFDPVELEKKARDSRSPLQVVHKARLWDAYCKDHAARSAAQADWLDGVFDRYFVPAYTREAQRVKSEAQAPPDDPAGPARGPDRG
jgi:type VI secretion system FHA domain protein